MDPRPPRVLIACETRRAFRAHGHEVWSCDLLPADDGETEADALGQDAADDARIVAAILNAYRLGLLIKKEKADG